MIQKNLRLYASILLGFVCFMLNASQAKALTVTPLRFELTANPGDTVSDKLRLYNDSDKTITYYFVTANFEAKDESGQPQFVPTTNDLAGWIQTQSSVTITPRSYSVIDFKIDVPANAEPGGYFSALFASTKPPSNGNEQKISLSGQVGALVLFRVNGNIKEGADILEYNTLAKQYFFSSLPVGFYFRFQNSGADRAKPLGDIIIKNIFGVTSKIVSVNNDGGSVLPKSIRRFESYWLESGGPKQQDPKFGMYSGSEPGFWNHVKYQWQHFALGRYSATLNLAYGYTTQSSATAKTSFWVLPWQLLLVEIISVVIALSILLGISVWIVYKIIRRIEKRLKK